MGLKEAIFGGTIKGADGYDSAYDGSVQRWIPVRDIIRGTVVTKDGRYIRVLEVLPVNFYTLSDSEKESVLSDMAAWLKIAPRTLQFIVRTQRFDMEAYRERQQANMEREEVGACQAMIQDNIREVSRLVENEAISHRFFVCFEYEPSMKARDNTPASVAERLEDVADTATRYLERCGLTVLDPEYSDNAILEVLYDIYNKSTSRRVKLPPGIFDMLTTVHGVYGKTDQAIQDAEQQAAVKKHSILRRKDVGAPRLAAGATTLSDILAPNDVDLTSADYVEIDGVYHAYLYIAGYGYATVVGKAWLAPLIEAGEGVSMSFTIKKQSRERAVSDIGQKTMWRRSQMRDVGDTRADYEQLGDAISAGIFLKEGINREGEDLYYMHTVLEVVADDPDTLEQRLSSLENLCVSMDMLPKRCTLHEEQGFLSVLPLLTLGPDIERKAKRNVLTSSVAAAFPFTSYELTDQTGIFLGLNMYNRSPVFIDNFDDYKYPNGNFCAFGSTGAGKSVLLQSVGGRYRQQGRHVIFIVPEKGHEFRPLCEAMGGQYARLGPSSLDCISELDIRPASTDVYNMAKGLSARNDSLLADKIAKVEIWYSLQKQDLTVEDKNLLDTSLVECYGRRGMTFDNDSLYEEDGSLKEMPVYADWYEILNAKKETRHLATVLARYVHGSAKSMGARTTIDIHNPYIVLDLTSVPEDLMIPTLYTATEFATDIIMMNGLDGTVLLADELWKLVGSQSNPLAANYVVSTIKLIRALGGIAGVTSQGLADMFALEDGKYGKSIINSSRIKIVLQLEEQEAEFARGKLNLTESEQQMITRFHRGEGLLCIGRNHVPVAFTVSPLEYEYMTTSPTDMRARATARPTEEEAADA